MLPLRLITISWLSCSRLALAGSMFMETRLWSDAIVPYVLDDLPHDLSESLRAGMRTWERGTCARFVKHTDQPSWIYFTKEDGRCWASMGMPDHGPTQVNIDMPNVLQMLLPTPMCSDENEGAPVHEIGHVLGMCHEHQRLDRDLYVNVYMDASRRGPVAEKDLVMLNCTMPTPFDPHSVMVYDQTPAVTDKTTDEPLRHKSLTPTEYDYMAVGMAYNCDELYTRRTPECRDVPVPDDNTDFPHSNYSLLLDEHTRRFMADEGYTHLGLRQHCKGKNRLSDTENWAFAPLRGSGADAPYDVQMDRCEKGFGRHAFSYELSMCKGDSEGSCKPGCGPRRVCPVLKDGKRVRSKAVVVVDPVLWICHYL